VTTDEVEERETTDGPLLVVRVIVGSNVTRRRGS